MFLACFVFINLGFVHLLAKLPFRSVTTTGVSAIGCGKELFSISIDVRSVAALSKCLVSRHSLKSFTDNQNWHDILQKYYMKYKQHIYVKENGKDETYATQKDTESFQSQSIFSCSRDPFTTWVSNLTSVCCCFWWRP